MKEIKNLFHYLASKYQNTIVNLTKNLKPPPFTRLSSAAVKPLAS